nr:hypothetical protein [Desulfogranum marinum]
MTMDIKTALHDVQQFKGGVIDTSTLIYLERLGLLNRLASVYRLLVVPQVLQEFGRSLPVQVIYVESPPGAADQVLCPVASDRRLAVLSDDKHVLALARSAGLVYFNTLMLLLLMLYNDQLTVVQYRAFFHDLLTFARYSHAVRAFGDQLLEHILSEKKRLTCRKTFLLQRES